MKRRRGFTLVEVLLAVAIAAMLIVTATTVTTSSVRTGELQRVEARRSDRRARTIEILQRDWRGRTGLGSAPAREEQAVAFALISTSDSVVDSRNWNASVVYEFSAKGIRRREAGELAGISLVEDPATVEFWDGTGWRSSAMRGALALRVVFGNPSESVVIR